MVDLAPAYGTNWGPEVMEKCGSEGRSGLRRINDLLYLIRNSNASPAVYTRMALLWTNAFAIMDEFPPKWDEWRALLEKFQLDESPDLKYWVPAIVHCQNRGWGDPGALASLSIVFTLSGNVDDSVIKPLSRLRQASKLTVYNPNYGECDQPERFFDDAEKLIQKAKDAQAHKPATKGLGEITARFKSNKNQFMALGPSAKLRLLRSANLSRGGKSEVSQSISSEERTEINPTFD